MQVRDSQYALFTNIVMLIKRRKMKGLLWVAQPVQYPEFVLICYTSFNTFIFLSSFSCILFLCLFIYPYHHLSSPTSFLSLRYHRSKCKLIRYSDSLCFYVGWNIPDVLLDRWLLRFVSMERSWEHKHSPTYKGMVRSDMSKPALIFFFPLQEYT
jgi:hypothetical protein